MERECVDGDVKLHKKVGKLDKVHLFFVYFGANELGDGREYFSFTRCK